MAEDSDDALGSLATLAVLGGAAFLGYQYVYLPWAAQQEFNRRVAEYQRQHGGSRQNAIDMISGAACVAVATKFGTNPALSVPLCSQLAPYITDAAKATPAALWGATKATGRATATIGKDIYSGGKAVVNVPVKMVRDAGKAVGGFFSKLF